MGERNTTEDDCGYFDQYLRAKKDPPQPRDDPARFALGLGRILQRRAQAVIDSPEDWVLRDGTLIFMNTKTQETVTLQAVEFLRGEKNDYRDA